MKAAAPLAGLRVIVTRPAHQAEPLCRLLEAQGAEAARLPLFAIEPLGEPAAQTEVLEAARGWDGWIFTSANAVRLAAERLAGEWPPLYAVGRASAAALEAAGHAGAVAPAAGSSSEALLELAPLQQVAGKRLLVITGEHGRGLLEQELARRGAQVETLALYRRRPLDYPEERLISELALAEASVLTSGEALERLWKIAPDAVRPQLQRQPLVVPSRRVLERAAELGFDRPLLPEDVSDEAIVRSLVDWRTSAASPNAVNPTPSPSDSTPESADALAGGSAAAPPPAAALPRRSGRAGLALAWLLVLLLAAALGYGGWLFWDLRQNQLALTQAQDHALRRLSLQAGELAGQAEALTTRQSDLARVVQRNGSELAAIQGRLEHSEQVMGRLTEELQGGRTRFALASVESLLLAANDRLLLERDVRGALVALQVADERLAQINDPRLFKVREAIAAERGQLQALPRPDLTSASLTLSSLIDRAASLPLRARVQPRRFGGGRAQPSEARESGAWYERLWGSVKMAVSSLFTVRRDDNARTLRLLPAEDEAVIYHVLILKLEGARVALLRGESAAFRESTRSAAGWLREFFRADDPGVLSALAELERLQPLELSAPPPDIAGSLALLRSYLEAPPQ